MADAGAGERTQLATWVKRPFAPATLGHRFHVHMSIARRQLDRHRDGQVVLSSLRGASIGARGSKASISENASRRDIYLVFSGPSAFDCRQIDYGWRHRNNRSALGLFGDL
jgi:hypothetical protein